MSEAINFPHLGIYLDHVGKNFSVFGIEIAYYGVTIAVAMLAGIFLALHVAKITGQNPDDYFDMAIENRKFQHGESDSRHVFPKCNGDCRYHCFCHLRPALLCDLLLGSV